MSSPVLSWNVLYGRRARRWREVLILSRRPLPIRTSEDSGWFLPTYAQQFSFGLLSSHRRHYFCSTSSTVSMITLEPSEKNKWLTEWKSWPFRNILAHCLAGQVHTPVDLHGTLLTQVQKGTECTSSFYSWGIIACTMYASQMLDFTYR